MLNIDLGPKVALSTESVNFNDVPHGVVVMRALHIQNNTSCPAFFQVCSILDLTKELSGFA